MFIRKNLRKGVPNLFVQLKRFYDSDVKQNILGNLYLIYRNNLDDYGTLGPVTCGKLDSSQLDDGVIEPPSTSLWLNYLIAQHYNFMGQTLV